MPLYRRLPKRGFKSLKNKNIAIINLSDLQNLLNNKRISTKDEFNLKSFKEKKIINKKYNFLKILGSGEIKNKIKISTNFISKSAKDKIEKAGGRINILEKK